MGLRHEVARQAWPDALEAALALGDPDEAHRLLALVADRPRGACAALSPHPARR